MLLSLLLPLLLLLLLLLLQQRLRLFAALPALAICGSPSGPIAHMLLLLRLDRSSSCCC